ncbi:hypothetical protein OLZ33_19200 [Pantoea ananatis]|uniref:hypothetical protein n=1 Tax=Pantoea ananas TaxID=553 RepID=UPI0022226280|nr:hypothetical protein [Pantoea ananatis]MCW1834110.1 hypothetical protein [Pantoea ananatis]
MLLNKSIPAVKVIRTLVLLSVMLLAGCDYGDRQFDEDRTKALQNPDAFQAYQQLNKDAGKNCHPGVFRATCSEEVHTAYQELALSLYRTALNRRSPAAFIDLFMRDDPPEELQSRMPQFAEELINLATHSAGDRSSARLLATAAHVLERGQWVQKDSVRAAAFFAQAWLAYDTKAPASLSRLYSEQHDEASALLWRLRCIGDCYNKLETAEPPATLSPREILRIQSLAKDRSIITVNGQANWEAK